MGKCRKGASCFYLGSPNNNLGNRVLIFQPPSNSLELTQGCQRAGYSFYFKLKSLKSRKSSFRILFLVKIKNRKRDISKYTAICCALYFCFHNRSRWRHSQSLTSATWRKVFEPILSTTYLVPVILVHLESL